MPDGIHGGHISEQRLGSADVGCRFFAFDVLFPGLKGHAKGTVPLGVDADADDSAGNGPLEFLFGGEEGGVRSAKSHGHAQPLGGTDGHVGTEFTGRCQKGQRQQVGCHDDVGAGHMGLSDKGAIVADDPVGAGVLDDGAEKGTHPALASR